MATSSFVGREQELAAGSDLVRSSRLVTLIGMGGAAKTRLALQAAAGLFDDYPDGVFLLDLAPLADSDLVAGRVARAIGLVEAQFRGAVGSEVDNLCAHPGERRMLLLLDNCEHLIEAVAQLTHEILARSPDVAILAISRQPLAVTGEILWRLSPLTMSSVDPATGGMPSGDAVSLFCERARAVVSVFTLTPANADAVSPARHGARRRPHGSALPGSDRRPPRRLPSFAPANHGSQATPVGPRSAHSQSTATDGPLATP